MTTSSDLLPPWRGEAKSTRFPWRQSLVWLQQGKGVKN
jgi:hypothetical protein